MDLKDQLSWREFLKESSKDTFISEVKAFNRLIAHSKNFFVIAGYGSFTKGYVLIITKDFLPSFGLIEEIIFDELNFLIKLLKKNIKKKYNRNAVIFEHGMCACIGGLDRAHLHIMSIDQNSSQESIENSIENVLIKRKAGINYIEFGNYKLENIHDVNQFMDSSEHKVDIDYKINGNLLKLNDIKNLDVNKWPFATLHHIKKGGHYVYFNSGFSNASFLTTKNFQTQFGREVIFDNEINLSKDFKIKIETLTNKNPMLEPWKWQNVLFDKNIIETVNETRKILKQFGGNYEYEYKKFEIHTL